MQIEEAKLQLVSIMSFEFWGTYYSPLAKSFSPYPWGRDPKEDNEGPLHYF